MITKKKLVMYNIYYIVSNKYIILFKITIINKENVDKEVWNLTGGLFPMMPSTSISQA